MLLPCPFPSRLKDRNRAPSCHLGHSTTQRSYRKGRTLTMAFRRRPCAEPCPHLCCNGHLSTNVREESPLACLYCSRTFSQVSILVRHVSSQHPENMYGGSGRNTDMVIKKRLSRTHWCPHCLWHVQGYSKKYMLGNHVRAMHTGEKSSMCMLFSGSLA